MTRPIAIAVVGIVLGGGLSASLAAVPELIDHAKVDPRVRVYVAPQRIIWQSPESGAVENAHSLLKEASPQVTLHTDNPCTLHNTGKPVGVLVDFGRELQGGVKIVVAGTPHRKPVQLRVRFGESAAEAMSELGGPHNATNDHAIRDETVLVPWLGSQEVGNTGFRFARVDLVDPNTVMQIKSLQAVLVIRDLEYRGAFHCSNPRLDRIWQTGAYTVHLNMQDFLWDGVKRDRLVWIGDMHPEMMTICAVFGRQDVVQTSLDLSRDDTPLPKWMNGISSYSLWWVLIHRDWYRHHGDLAYLRQQQPYLTALLRQLMQHIGPDNAEQLTGMRFLDWPTSENPKSIHAGLHALLILALAAGDELCGVLGDEATQAQCRIAATRLRKHVPDPGSCKQAAALMVLAGLLDPVQTNRNVLAVDGSRRMSTFYGYYVLQARAKAGDYQGCLDSIRTFWGAMLDLGATTFWEDFNLDWLPGAARIDQLVGPNKKDIHGDFGAYCYQGFRHSLCHGWASGPTAWLSEHVLGVRILEPGCRAVRIEPHLGDLDWAEGTFPTPLGPIKVRHERQPDGRVRSNVETPPGVRLLGT